MLIAHPNKVRVVWFIIFVLADNFCCLLLDTFSFG